MSDCTDPVRPAPDFSSTETLSGLCGWSKWLGPGRITAVLSPRRRRVLVYGIPTHRSEMSSQRALFANHGHRSARLFVRNGSRFAKDFQFSNRFRDFLTFMRRLSQKPLNRFPQPDGRVDIGIGTSLIGTDRNQIL